LHRKCKDEERKETIMAAVATMNVPLTYNQVYAIVMQLPIREQLKLERRLSAERFTSPLRKIHKKNVVKNNPISEEEILKECKTVRSERYAAGLY